MNWKPMTLPEFAKGMYEHFHIRDSQKYLDVMLSHVFRSMSLDVIAFDEWLHERHGEYEEEQGMSMSQVVLEYYGEDAHRFVQRALGVDRREAEKSEGL